VKDLEHILKRCQKRDQAALEKLYDYVFNDIMGICMRYQQNRENAEELVNDCFIHIVGALKKRNAEIPLMYWVKRVTVNKNIDALRKQKAQYNINEQMWRSDEADYFIGEAIDHVNQKINVDNILYNISLLASPQKEIFNLYVIDGYSHQEIADTLNMSVASSRFHLHYARKNLKNMLKKTNVRRAKVNI
jgi:RNA polymerase sigma-70 factor (ECF subfamily)